MYIIVEIKSISGVEELHLDGEKDLIVYNNNIVENANANRLINRILRITASWEENMKGDGFDGEEYNVYITNGEESMKFHGKNAFPVNYFELKDLLSEVQDD